MKIKPSDPPRLDLPVLPFKVLDLTEGGHNLCGRLLGDMGADVVRVEPPGGSPTRLRGPFASGAKDLLQHSLYWAAYNSNKRGITLDISSQKGQEILSKLISESDVILESFSPGYLECLGISSDFLDSCNSKLVHTSITPFGSSGPHSQFISTDLITSAMGGMPYLSGDKDRPPVRISFPQAELNAGSQAFAGTMAALWQSNRTGIGQRVEVSEQVAVIWTLMNATPFPPLEKMDMKRAGTFRQRGPIEARHVYKCKDGHVTILAQAATLDKLLKWMIDEDEVPPDVASYDPISWNITTDSQTNSREIYEFKRLEEFLEKFMLMKNKSELFDRAVSDKLLLAPCNTVQDISKSLQLESRNYWVDLYHPELEREIRHLGPPIRLSKTPFRLRCPSPSIGQHNEEIYGELGLNSDDQFQLNEQGVI